MLGWAPAITKWEGVMISQDHQAPIRTIYIKDAIPCINPAAAAAEQY